jgi:hypothetical protein
LISILHDDGLCCCEIKMFPLIHLQSDKKFTHYRYNNIRLRIHGTVPFPRWHLEAENDCFWNANIVGSVYVNKNKFDIGLAVIMYHLWLDKIVLFFTMNCYGHQASCILYRSYFLSAVVSNVMQERVKSKGNWSP